MPSIVSNNSSLKELRKKNAGAPAATKTSIIKHHPLGTQGS